MTDQIDHDTAGDHTTLLEVLDGYRSAGYVGDFFVTAEAAVECAACTSVLEPTRLGIVSARRLEGVSDPADMLSVVCTTCPVCGQDGTVVLGFGPMASPVDADVLAAMRDVRMDDRAGAEVPPDGAPNDMPDDAR